MIKVSRELLLLITAVVTQGMDSLHRSLPVEEGWNELLAYYASGRRDNLEVALGKWGALLVHEQCSQSSLRRIIENEIERVHYNWFFVGLSQIWADSYNFKSLDIQHIYCTMKQLRDILTAPSMPDNTQVDRLRRDLWYCLCIMDRRAVNLKGRKFALQVEHFRAAHWRHYLTIQEIIEHCASRSSR